MRPSLHFWSSLRKYDNRSAGLDEEVRRGWGYGMHPLAG